MRVVLGGHPPSVDGVQIVDDASEWPFRRHITPPPPAAPAAAVHITNLHLAFPSAQVAGTRLVLTQSTYQLQRWLDWEARHPGVTVTADASGPALRQGATEAFARRGPWSRIEIVEGADDVATAAAAVSALRRAFVQPDPVPRREESRLALAADPGNPALLLALGSAHMELQDVGAALDAVEEAVSLAPDWEATHFELGKAWLRADDTARAADAFARAARLMPGFATAWSNLGAALGELERRDDALVALRHALEHDPYGHPTLNNLGVVLRDLGHLADAESAFRQVVALAPGFVFGRYNLAQTLLLAQQYEAARAAYEEAVERDPQKSARQAIRLAVARAATGAETEAIAALEDAVTRLTGEPLAQALDEAERALSGMSGAVAGNEAAVAGVLRLLRVRSGRP
jgi:tetratricopeptide (TPR) repeat protein